MGGQVYGTDNNGYFSSKLTSGSSNNIKPLPVGRSSSVLRAKDHAEVSAIDVALVQSHILQKSLLNSPYKIIAADASGDGKVTALDIVYMKRLILAVDTSLPGNRTWGFVDSSYVFPDPTNPFPHKDSIILNSLSANHSNQSFIGFVLGDINWSATSPRMVNGKSIELYYNNLNAHNGNTILVPVAANNFNNMIGMQYTIHYNNDAFDFEGINNNIRTPVLVTIILCILSLVVEK